VAEWFATCGLPYFGPIERHRGLPRGLRILPNGTGRIASSMPIMHVPLWQSILIGVRWAGEAKPDLRIILSPDAAALPTTACVTTLQ
jgi:hypothetical protein